MYVLASVITDTHLKLHGQNDEKAALNVSHVSAEHLPTVQDVIELAG